MRKLIVAIVIIAVLVWTASPMLEIMEQKRQLATLQSKLASLKDENRALRDDIKRFSDPGFIEVLAREKLGLVKEGERSYVVIPPRESRDDAAAEAAPEASGDAADKGNSDSAASRDHSAKAATPDPVGRSDLVDRILRFLGLGSDEAK